MLTTSAAMGTVAAQMVMACFAADPGLVFAEIGVILHLARRATERKRATRENPRRVPLDATTFRKGS